MAITMDIAKAAIRLEYKGPVFTQEELDAFFSSLSEAEFMQLLGYSEAWCDMYLAQAKGVA